MKHYMNIGFKIMLAHMKAQTFSLILGPLVFYFLLSEQSGWYLMSTATIIFYIVMLYSASYKIGTKDIKVYSENKPYMLKGIVITFMTLAVTLIISLMYHFSFSLSLPSFKAETITRLTVQIIFTWWGYSFEGFRTAYDGSIWWVYWLMSYFILPLTSFLGYLAGTKEYELSHKFFSWLVYKKDNKD